MDIEEIRIRIKCDDDAIANDSRGEITQILQGMIDHINDVGVVSALEGRRLFDSNGVCVGECEVAVDWNFELEGR